MFRLFTGDRAGVCLRAISAALTDAVKSLQIGPAEDPGTRIGPVIDNDSRDRLLEFIRKVDPEHGGQVVLAMDPGPLSRQGSFIGPHIFTNVDPVAPLAQQELFGPILAVIRVRTLDDAITVANGTRYALTAGVYSRSPVTLKRVRAELQAGNLYLNREITGAAGSASSVWRLSYVWYRQQSRWSGLPAAVCNSGQYFRKYDASRICPGD